MTGKRPWIGWMICWKYISPFLLSLVLIGVLYTSASKTATYSAFVGCIQVAEKPSDHVIITIRVNLPFYNTNP